MKNIKTRTITVEIKGKDVKYIEKYVVNENEEEIFDRGIELENDIRLYDEYKRLSGLLTSTEIKEIRQKYGLNQKEYALVLGMGEISIHRFEKGSVQTETIDNIMRLSNNPSNLKEMLERQKKNLSLELYAKLTKTIDNLLTLKEHAVIDIKEINNNDILVETLPVSNIAEKIIKRYNQYINKDLSKYGVSQEYITNAKLQKLLYYVQAYSLYLYDKKAFKEKIYAGKQGPIIQEIEILNKNILCEETEEYIINENKSNIDSIIDVVVDKYGKIETNKLVELSCNEDPFLNTKLGEEIKAKEIKQYITKIYSI